MENWLSRAINRDIIDELRKLGREAEREKRIGDAEANEQYLESATSPEPDLDRELYEEVMSYLQAHRGERAIDVFSLRFVEELEVAEVAQQLRLTNDQVYEYTRQAKDQILAHFQKSQWD